MKKKRNKSASQRQQSQQLQQEQLKLQSQLRQKNQLRNILMLALIAAALAAGDWLTATQHTPWYFIGFVIVSAGIFVAVRRYNTKVMQ